LYHSFAQSPSIYLAQLRFLAIPTTCPNFILFYLNLFLMEILLDIQQLFHCMSKHYETNSMQPLLIKGFPMIVKATRRTMGDFNVANKTNKLPSFIYGWL
jgi:hypothetical protein